MCILYEEHTVTKRKTFFSINIEPKKLENPTKA